MAGWLQHTVSAPPAEVLRRLSAELPGLRPDMRLGPATVGTLAAASRRHAIERNGASIGWMELTPLTSSATLLEAAAEAPDAEAILEHIATAACGPVATGRRAAAQPRSPWQRPGVRAVAVVTVLALITGSAAAYRLLAPPEPLAVDQAVAQFQQTPAPAAAVVAPRRAPQPARRSGAGDATPRRRRQPVRQQPATTTAARGSDDRPRQAVPPQEPRTQRRPAKRRDAQAPGPRERAAQPAPLPAAGVYTYATDGHEEIDQPSDRHDYPDRTALTVQHTGCGFTTRWQPLEERWDETEICTGKVRTLARMTTQREFFGRRQRSDYRCEPDSRAWHNEAGAAWTTRCSDDDTTVTTRLEVLGYERIAVGDDVVRAVHLRLRATVTGATRGKWAADRWLHPDTGLLLRLHGSTDATSTTPFGDVRYREQVRLDLQSLEPQR